MLDNNLGDTNMAKTELKQFIPVFVGSTYEDLRPYRKSIMESLHKLETIVRGMEYFGAKPNSPLSECLDSVKSCKIYIGIFGMRYGTIPHGDDKSMTHLEYEQSQEINLPSLIYIINSDKQPILAKYIDTGYKAKKLEKLKNHLKQKHVVSFFTTEHDLSKRILSDLPPVLKDLGMKIADKDVFNKTQETSIILKNFDALPKLWQNKEVEIQFIVTKVFYSIRSTTIEALGLEVGGTVCSYQKINNERSERYIFGENEMAQKLMSLLEGSQVTAKGLTLFGVDRASDLQHDEVGNPIVSPSIEKGILIQEIIKVV